MIKKKAKKAEKKASARKSAKKRVYQKKPKDPAKVRQELADVVKAEAKDITKAVIVHAEQGELAPAKYLFEMAGIFPACTDGSLASQDEECFAETLLRRLDLPDKPVAMDDEEEEGQVAAAKKSSPEKAGEGTEEAVVTSVS